MFEFITNPEERGQVGIGTLIVFIAMVLVAAIAAGVLINTAGFLQSQAEATGQESTDLVSERIEVGSSVGIVASGASNLKEIRVTVSGAPGSDNIDLTETTIQAVGPGGQENLVFADISPDTSLNADLSGSNIDAQTQVSEDAGSVDVSVGDGYASIDNTYTLTVSKQDGTTLGSVTGDTFAAGDVVTVDFGGTSFTQADGPLNVELNDGTIVGSDTVEVVAAPTVGDLATGEFAVQSDGQVQDTAVLNSESQYQIILDPSTGAFSDGTAFGEGQKATLDIVSPAGAATQVELRAPDLFNSENEAVRL